MCASTPNSPAPTRSPSPSSSPAPNSLFDQSRDQFHQFLTVQASIRGLPAVILLDKDLKVVDQVHSQVGQSFNKSSPEVLSDINDTEPQVAMFLEANYVAAIIKLRGYEIPISTLPAARSPRSRAIASDAAGVARIRRPGGAPVRHPDRLRLMYTVIALIVLLSAVWIGLNFANCLVAPIRR